VLLFADVQRRMMVWVIEFAGMLHLGEEAFESLLVDEEAFRAEIHNALGHGGKWARETNRCKACRAPVPCTRMDGNPRSSLRGPVLMARVPGLVSGDRIGHSSSQ